MDLLGVVYKNINVLMNKVANIYNVDDPNKFLSYDSDSFTLTWKLISLDSLQGFNNDSTTFVRGDKTMTSLTSADVPQTLTHLWISDFDAQVNTHALNQLAAPTTNLSLNSHLLTNVLNPVSAQDAATKNYVDTRYDNKFVLYTGLGTAVPLGVNNILPIGGYTVATQGTGSGVTLNVGNNTLSLLAGTYTVKVNLPNDKAGSIDLFFEGVSLTVQETGTISPIVIDRVVAISADTFTVKLTNAANISVLVGAYIEITKLS